MTTQDIMAAIDQLGPVDLERVAYKVSKLRMRRLTGREAELLKAARRRRPRDFDRRYRELIRKRQDESLTKPEYQELLLMTDEAELHYASRIQALAELAELRQTDLDTLMHELGLTQRG